MKLQIVRRTVQVAVLLLMVALAFLSLYAHYRSARVIEDEQLMAGLRGELAARALHPVIERLSDPQAFLDGNKGTLWSMTLFGFSISDPLAAAEAIASTKHVHWPLLLSIVAPVLLTLLLGKVFCSWLCPGYLAFEAAGKLRRLLRFAEIEPAEVRFAHANKYIVLVVGLALAAVISAPLFALVYPPALLSRVVHAWIFGTQLGGMLVLFGAIVAFELFVSPRWWCRTMCPGGALYGLLGAARPLRVRLVRDACTGCKECIPVCEAGINPITESESIECDNCGVCIRHCGPAALRFVVARPRLRAPKRGKDHSRATTAAVGVLATAGALLSGAPASGHHVLGLPHYSYKENYPQRPTLEYPATTGPYDVLFTSYPGVPVPGEPANLAFYVKNRQTSEVYDRPITVRVLETSTFGENVIVLAPTECPPFDNQHKFQCTFPRDAEYVVELSLEVEGRTEVIPFLVVAGDPTATASVVLAAAAALVVALVAVRAVVRKKRRRAQGDARQHAGDDAAARRGISARSVVPAFLFALLALSASGAPAAEAEAGIVDVVCHMEVDPGWGYSAVHDGTTYHFCTRRCKDLFRASPEGYLAERCLVCRRVVADAETFDATYLGKTYRLCSAEHRKSFKEDPAAYFLHRMWGIPTWLYYASIGLVLVLSFGVFEWFSRLRERLPSATARAARPLRYDLLRHGWVSAAVRSRPFRFGLQLLLFLAFALIVAAGCWGNQNPALNVAPLLTWTIWWGLLPIFIIFAGKFWCYVCPWDAAAGWLERLSFWRKVDDGLSARWRWPRIVRNISIATILFVGLTWVELGFGVTMKPRVTAYLAIGMLLLAVVSALLFDRKSFCRYGCLVGRVSGLYAQFSTIEVRPRDAEMCASCRTKECVKGSATAYGCPTYLYPGNLAENTYCIQCMECAQACPHDNIALNLRPPATDLVATDLVTEGKPRSDEAYLALLMLSITGFHGLTMTPAWQELVVGVESATGLGRIVGFSAGMSAVLLAPIAVYTALVGVSYLLGRGSSVRPLTFGDYFVRYAYTLLPIALFYHIAHNLEHLLMEGPKIVALASDPFGRNWDLFGTASWSVPPLISLEDLWILQAVLVLVGHVYSLWVAQRAATRLFGSSRAAFRSQLPVLAGMVAFSVFSLWLLKQPMEMRTSAM